MSGSLILRFVCFFYFDSEKLQHIQYKGNFELQAVSGLVMLILDGAGESHDSWSCALSWEWTVSSTMCHVAKWSCSSGWLSIFSNLVVFSFQQVCETDEVSLCADKHLPIVEKGKLITVLGSHKPQALTKYYTVLHIVKRTPGFLSSVCFGNCKKIVSLSQWESYPWTAAGQKSSRTGEQIITAGGRTWS